MRNTENSLGVIVIGDHVQALGIIRSLGRHHIPVYLLHDKNLCIGKFSRYTKRFIRAPSPSNELEFVNFLIRLTKNEQQVKGWILMPTNDTAVYTLSRHKETLEEYYKVPTPSWNIVKFAYNKRLTYSIAEKNNVPVPKTFYPENPNTLHEILSSITFPVIIKGIVGRYFYQKTGIKAFKVNSEEELIEKYTNLLSVVKPSEIMIQEVIHGSSSNHVYSFCSFFKNRELVAFWIGQKIREHPKDLGTATFAESIYIPEIKELGTRILKAMNYYGISEIEFKKDPRDGNFKLIEMNARTWLWHSLAIRCGVDFPYLLYRDMMEESVTPVTSFRENVKWIHIYTDIGIMIREVLKKNLKIRDYLSSLKGEKEFAVLSLDDPLPFIVETLILPYLWKNR